MRWILYIFDAPHVITVDDKVAIWNGCCPSDAFHQMLSIRCCPKLTNRLKYPNSFFKMKVKLATQDPHISFWYSWNSVTIWWCYWLLKQLLIQANANDEGKKLEFVKIIKVIYPALTIPTSCYVTLRCTKKADNHLGDLLCLKLASYKTFWRKNKYLLMHC